MAVEMGVGVDLRTGTRVAVGAKVGGSTGALMAGSTPVAAGVASGVPLEHARADANVRKIAINSSFDMVRVVLLWVGNVRAAPILPHLPNSTP